MSSPSRFLLKRHTTIAIASEEPYPNSIDMNHGHQRAAGVSQTHLCWLGSYCVVTAKPAGAGAHQIMYSTSTPAQQQRPGRAGQRPAAGTASTPGQCPAGGALCSQQAMPLAEALTTARGVPLPAPCLPLAASAPACCWGCSATSGSACNSACAPAAGWSRGCRTPAADPARPVMGSCAPSAPHVQTAAHEQHRSGVCTIR